MKLNIKSILLAMFCVYSSLQCFDFKELAVKSLELTKNGLSVGAQACGKVWSGMSKEAAFTEQVYNDASRGVTRELLCSGRIWLASIAASCIWGLINGQITRKFYADYFTKGYTAQFAKKNWPKFELDNPRKGDDGLQWPHNLIRPAKFIVERILFGSSNFMPLIHAARAGQLPRLSVRNLVLPTGVALGCMAACSGIAGLIGKKLASSGKITQNMVQEKTGLTPLKNTDEHDRCIGAFFAHNIGYLSSCATTLGMTAWMIHKRYALAAAAH